MEPVPLSHEWSSASKMIDATLRLHDDETREYIARKEFEMALTPGDDADNKIVEQTMNALCFGTHTIPRRVEVFGPRFVYNAETDEYQRDDDELGALSSITVDGTANGIRLVPAKLDDATLLTAMLEVSDFSDRMDYFYPVLDIDTLRLSSQSWQVENLLRVMGQLNGTLHNLHYSGSQDELVEIIDDMLVDAHHELDKFIPDEPEFCVSTDFYFVLPTGNPVYDLYLQNSTVSGTFPKERKNVFGTFSCVEAPINLQPDIVDMVPEYYDERIDPYEICMMLFDKDKKCQYAIPLSSIDPHMIIDSPLLS